MGGWEGDGAGNVAEYFYLTLARILCGIHTLGVCVPSSHCLLFPRGAEGLGRSLSNLRVFCHSSHTGRRDRSHRRAGLMMMRGAQVRRIGEVVSKDRECLILLPPTDLFQRIQG